MARSDGVKARALHVRRIAEERQHAFVSIARKCVKIKRHAAYRRLINLEVASMDDYSDRCAYRERHAIDRAVRHGNKFNFVWPDFYSSPR